MAHVVKSRGLCDYVPGTMWSKKPHDGLKQTNSQKNHLHASSEGSKAMQLMAKKQMSQPSLGGAGKAKSKPLDSPRHSPRPMESPRAKDKQHYLGDPYMNKRPDVQEGFMYNVYSTAVQFRREHNLPQPTDGVMQHCTEMEMRVLRDGNRDWKALKSLYIGKGSKQGRGL